jgi:transcriptional regulator of acetoin/glycerol metabolism
LNRRKSGEPRLHVAGVIDGPRRERCLAPIPSPRSDRSRNPFVVVNCAAIPESLIESELFGHRRGSFTGAVSDKQGKFEAANKGTIFLDEIGELPLLMQVKTSPRSAESGNRQSRRIAAGQG